MKSNWMDKQVSFYTTHRDNKGQALSYRNILYNISPEDMQIISAIRSLNQADPDFYNKKIKLKSTLSCFTPAALLASKAKGELQVIKETGIMQLDFDFKEIKSFDIEELKQMVFNLPFIAFCSLSCSGDGFYALALISQPERLSDYAEHCFEVLKGYGIQPDESKGKKVENLRYLSYDVNMLIRDNPDPLIVTNFKRKETKKKLYAPTRIFKHGSNNALINKMITEVLNVVPGGGRMPTVQRAAYTLGGLSNPNIIQLLYDAINTNSAFADRLDNYLKCASDCFKTGQLKPLITK